MFGFLSKNHSPFYVDIRSIGLLLIIAFFPGYHQTCHTDRFIEPVS